jgi:hypothetical protein
MTIDSAAHCKGYRIYHQLRADNVSWMDPKRGECGSVYGGKHPMKGAAPATFSRGPTLASTSHRPKEQGIAPGLALLQRK